MMSEADVMEQIGELKTNALKLTEAVYHSIKHGDYEHAYHLLAERTRCILCWMNSTVDADEERRETLYAFIQSIRERDTVICEMMKEECVEIQRILLSIGHSKKYSP